MKLHSLRTILLRSVLALCAAVFVASCGGGGGASANPGGPAGVSLSLLPATGTFYAGIPYTMTIVGGRKPFIVSSSEPSLMPVPQTLNENTFQVLPANPAVIDANLPEGSLPIRTVIITVRDSLGFTTTADIKVGRNFLTGYGISFLSNCPAEGSEVGPAACAGGETVVRLISSINGNLNGGRQYRFEVLRGPFGWVFPGSNVVGNSVTVTTDHEGTAQAILRVNPSVPTQLAVLRVIDVQTGVFVDHVFTISSAGTNTIALEIIPDEFTFTGRNTAECGTGAGDFFVFDGTPPYRAVAASPFVNVQPATSTTNPGRFTVTVSNPTVCLGDSTIIITDANGSRGTVTVTTEPGSADPPPPPITIQPSLITLGCGQAGSVSVIGGTGQYSVSSVSPFVAGIIDANTLTVARAATGSTGGTGIVSFPVNVTDGSSITTLTVNAPATCP